MSQKKIQRRFLHILSVKTIHAELNITMLNQGTSYFENSVDPDKSKINAANRHAK